MADGFALKAAVRERTGKGAARALRREGLIPAVIYGINEPPVAISIPQKEVTLALYGGGFLTNIWKLDVDGKSVQALARDYQREPLKDRLVHVDFLRVSAKSRVTVDVPLSFPGEDQSPGLSEGGVLNVPNYTLSIEAPAASIPNSIEIDVSALEMGAAITTADLSLPEGVTLAGHSEEPVTLASITPPSSEPAADDADATGAAEAGDDGADSEGSDTASEAE